MLVALYLAGSSIDCGPRNQLKFQPTDCDACDDGANDSNDDCNDLDSKRIHLSCRQLDSWSNDVMHDSRTFQCPSSFMFYSLSTQKQNFLFLLNFCLFNFEIFSILIFIVFHELYIPS